MIETREGLYHYMVCQLIYRLKTEIKTGLRFRESTVKAVNTQFKTSFRRRQEALDALVEAYKFTYGNTPKGFE